MGCGNNNSLIIKKKLAAKYGKKELVHFKICELNFELVHVILDAARPDPDSISSGPQLI